MTFDVLRPRGKSCENCKHLSKAEYSGQVLMDFGYKGPYWKCESRSQYDKNEVFPREIIVYTDGSSLCSNWEQHPKAAKPQKDKKR